MAEHPATPGRPGPDDRLPPRNRDCELQLLGAILFDPACLHDVAPIVEPGDLYFADHAAVYGEIRALYDAGHPVDLASVSERLERSGLLERLGGWEFLQDLRDRVPHSASAAYHAQIVRDKAVARRVIEVCNETLRDGYSDLHAADDLVASALARLHAATDRLAGRGDVPIGDAALRAIDAISRRGGGRERGLATGLPGLDGMIDGFLPECVYVIAGRPGSGKSSLALQMAHSAAVEQDKNTLFVSLEMSAQLLAERLLQGRAGVDGDAVCGRRDITPAEMASLGRAYEAVRRAPLVIDEDPVHTPTQIAANARRHKHRRGLDILFVDYLQLIDPGGNQRASRQEQVAQISRSMKLLAGELKIPIVLLSQLNRANEAREDKRPRMSDLRESGSIENDADVVMLLHRPEYYDPMETPGLAELNVAKNRNGPTGKVLLHFNSKQTYFGPWDAMQAALANGEEPF